MAEVLIVLDKSTKEEQYESLLPQLESLLSGESDFIANMANVSAALKLAFNFLWVGFYIVRDETLVLGPFQGSIACTRIKYGRGVCGTAWKNARAVIVPDVDAFDGHITCDSSSKSEIVLPLLKDNKVFAVLDVDSEQLNTFDEIDAKYLQQILNLFRV